MIIAKQYYRSKLGMGPSYVDLLPKNLTIDPDFTARRFSERRNTLFKEVVVVPASEIITPPMRRLFNAKPTRKETKREFFQKLIARLRAYILEVWDPEKDHVILHSSGLDSRMISWTIKRLHNEFGDKWLGNTVFTCSKWEDSCFNGIMQYEGWDKSQYVVPNEAKHKTRYYESSLVDFDGAWERCGVSAIPVNLFWYLPEHAQKLGYVGDDIQTFTGQWGNSIFDWGNESPEAGENFRKMYKMFYWSVLFQRPMKGELTHLFADSELGYLVSSSTVRLGKRLRPELLAFMDKRLATFTNMRSDGDRHQKIADDIINKMIADYRASWYGKNIAPQARIKHKTTEFQPWYSRWTSASLCKHLLKSGYTIRKG